MEEQEQKPNIVYGLEVRQYERTGNYPQFGRSYFYLTCPFCQRELKVYPWSLAGSGRNCPCGAKHGGWGLSRKKVAKTPTPDDIASKHNEISCICVDFLNCNPDPVANPDCPLHGTIGRVE